MGDGDLVGVNFGRSALHIENTLVTADTVGIDMVELRGKPGVYPLARQGKDVDARHQGMTCCMTLGAADFGMEGRLFPERRCLLLMMAGDTEFFSGRCVGGKGDRRIKQQDHHGSSQGPNPKRKMWKFKLQHGPLQFIGQRPSA